MAPWPPSPRKLMHTPIPQSGSVLCPLVMDYCKEEGEDRGAVYATLIDEVNTAGVPRDKDNNSICGAGGGLKRDICSRYIFVQEKKKKHQSGGKTGVGRRVFGCILKYLLHQSSLSRQGYRSHWQLKSPLTTMMYVISSKQL